MTVKHTPGPWFINTNSDECLIGKLSVESTGGYYICQVDEGVRQEANASLIAAAPDLLDALKGILGYFDSGNSVPVSQATIKAASDEVKAAIAAIAKATGKPS